MTMDLSLLVHWFVLFMITSLTVFFFTFVHCNFASVCNFVPFVFLALYLEKTIQINRDSKSVQEICFI